MRNRLRLSAWSRGTMMLALGSMLVACAPSQRPESAQGTWAGRPIGAAPAPKPAARRAIISRATREWELFGRQTVQLKGHNESIPNVGHWEDDSSRYSSRVNAYWRAVGKPSIDGADCRQPWSSAFMGWIMAGAGIPRGQFPRVPAHWMYLSSAIESAAYPGRYFVPRRIGDYSPNPGDLICAYRGTSSPPSASGYPSPWRLRGTPTHCDLVVHKQGRTLEAIGGNVRNSVSKVTLELDGAGHLQRVPRRPWFLILENRL